MTQTSSALNGSVLSCSLCYGLPHGGLHGFRLHAPAACRTAARGGALAGPCQIQFHRRQQRCGRSAGRRPDRGGDSLAQARGAQSRDLQSGARPARLPSAARVPGDEAQARRRDERQRRRHPDAVRLVAGARSGQRRAADARRHRDLREGQLPEHADALRAAWRDGDRHSARQGRHAHGRARRSARRLQGARRAAEDDLHHPDGAKPDRHDPARGAARRAAAALRSSTASRCSRTTAIPT